MSETSGGMTPLSEEQGGAEIKRLAGEMQYGSLQEKGTAELDGYFDAETLRAIADVLDRTMMEAQ